jgi:CHAD domain-containing protein
MAASVVQEPRSTRVRRGLQRTLRSLSELRDIQVQLLLVRDMLPRHPQLALVRTILLMKQTRCIRRMRARVSRLSITTDAMAVEHLTACIDRAFQDSSRARQRRAAVVATTTLAFARAVQMKELVDRARPASIHRLRVAFKKFRYRAETLQPLLPSLTRDRLSAMNAYQTRMGSIQDVDLLLVVVRGLAARRRRGDPPLRPVVLELLERRRELIRMFLASSADLYGFWPVPVHAPLTVFAGARRTS